MGNKTIFRVVMCIIILSTFTLPVSAQQPDKTNEYEVSLKKLMEVTGASASIDEVLSYTLSVAKMNVSEFESPLGERYKESAMGICAKPCRCWLVGYRWTWERNCVRKLAGVRR